MFMPAPRAGAVTTRALTNPASPSGTPQARRRDSCAIADLNVPPPSALPTPPLLSRPVF
jgi:hypothetical protein